MVVVRPEEKPMIPMEPNGTIMMSESSQSDSQSTDLEKSFEVGFLKLGAKIFIIEIWYASKVKSD